jgi:hypothetical protein
MEDDVEMTIIDSAKSQPGPRRGVSWAAIKKKNSARYARQRLVLEGSVCHALFSLRLITNKLQ